MSNKIKPQVGDTVRVSREFVVGEAYDRYIRAEADVVPHNFYYTTEWDIEVVKTREVKAGDEVGGNQARALPIGSVVLYEPGGGASIKVSETDWASSNGQFEPNWLNVTKLRVLHVGIGV